MGKLDLVTVVSCCCGCRRCVQIGPGCMIGFRARSWISRFLSRWALHTHTHTHTNQTVTPKFATAARTMSVLQNVWEKRSKLQSTTFIAVMRSRIQSAHVSTRPHPRNRCVSGRQEREMEFATHRRPAWDAQSHTACGTDTRRFASTRRTTGILSRPAVPLRSSTTGI